MRIPIPINANDIVNTLSGMNWQFWNGRGMTAPNVQRSVEGLATAGCNGSLSAISTSGRKMATWCFDIARVC